MKNLANVFEVLNTDEKGNRDKWDRGHLFFWTNFLGMDEGAFHSYIFHSCNHWFSSIQFESRQ